MISFDKVPKKFVFDSFNSLSSRFKKFKIFQKDCCVIHYHNQGFDLRSYLFIKIHSIPKQIIGRCKRHFQQFNETFPLSEC